jgi:hypothetical protein
MSLWGGSRWGKIGTVTDEVGLLGRALNQAAAVIGAIRLDQAEQATPCRDWDVRALVRHVVGQDLRNFMISARRDRQLAGAARRAWCRLGRRVQ